MKKKIIALLTMAALAATMTACGEKAANNEPVADAPAAADAADEEYEDEGYEDEGAEDEGNEEENGGEEENYDEETAEADNSDSGEFTLLDISSDMINIGIYAIDDEQTEPVFSLFNAPSGTPMASMFMFCADGSGDVICGSYESMTEVDENGITRTKLTVSDVYTGETFVIGFAESDEQVYIFNAAGSVYEGQYLSADETIVYMGSAAALLG